MPYPIVPWYPEVDQLSLSIVVEPHCPPLALAGVGDWVHQVAHAHYRMTHLPFDEAPNAIYRVHLCWESPRPNQLASFVKEDDKTWIARAIDVDACNHLFRTLAHHGLSLPSEWRELAIDHRGHLWADGRRVIVDTDPVVSHSHHAESPALLHLIPGQGPIYPIEVPPDATLDWMKALINYVARASLSDAGVARSHACVLPGEGHGIVRLGSQSDEAYLQADQILLPMGSAGLTLFDTLAHVPTYPERPWYLDQAMPLKAHHQRIFTKEWSVPWEIDRLENILRQDVIPRLDSARPTSLEIFASEPLEILQAFQERVEQILCDFGYSHVITHVSPAYKQAFHFGRDRFVPAALNRLHTLKSVRIGVPIIEPGVDLLERSSAWVPTITPLEAWIESLDAGATVELHMIPGSSFQFVAENVHGQEYRDSFQPLTTSLNMDAVYPGKHSLPETGGVRLTQAGIVQQWFEPTDTEAAFRAYLNALPHLKQLVSSRSVLPLFASLSLEAWLSDPDHNETGPMTDGFSPLDELHEELYFGTLAALEPLTQEITDGNFRAPGLIQPLVHQRLGQHTLLRITMDMPDTEVLGRSTTDVRKPFIVKSIHATSSGLVLDTGTPLNSNEFPATLLPQNVTIRFTDQTITAPTVPTKISHLPQQPVPPNEVWPLCQTTSASLTWIEGKSFGQRPIPVMVFVPDFHRGIISIPKMSVVTPSLLVIGGHHANEPSSTVAAFHLMESLAYDPIPVIVATVPLENPDGAALFHTLYAGHPTWKLHAARFNMLGHEFAQDYDRESPFGEARVRPAMESYLAATVVIDNHGVPARDWAQPFSGRTSPPLFSLSYTYPSGLFYGIGEGNQVSGQPTDIVETYWQAITARLTANHDLLDTHQSLWNRYVKSGIALSPRDYPSRLVGGWPFQTMARATSSYRYQPESRTRLITEVADEGAPAELFQHCVSAHVTANTAVIGVLSMEQSKPGTKTPRNCS